MEQQSGLVGTTGAMSRSVRYERSRTICDPYVAECWPGNHVGYGATRNSGPHCPSPAHVSRTIGESRFRRTMAGFSCTYLAEYAICPVAATPYHCRERSRDPGRSIHSFLSRRTLLSGSATGGAATPFMLWI